MAKLFQQCFSAVSSLVSKVLCVKKDPVDKKLGILEQKIKTCEGELYEKLAAMKTQTDRLLFYGFGIYFLIVIQILGGRQLYVLMCLALVILPLIILSLANVVYVEYRKQISQIENQLLKLYAKKRLLMAEARKVSDIVTWKSILTKYDNGCFYRRAQLMVNPACDCSICHEHMDGRGMVSLLCGHVYHEVCIMIWLREATTCPICCLPTRRFQEMGCFCPSQDMRSHIVQLYFVGPQSSEECTNGTGEQRTQLQTAGSSLENQAHCRICNNLMLDGELATLICGHVFHSICLETWLTQKTACPICVTQVERRAFLPYVLHSLGLSEFLISRHNFVKLYLT